MNPQTAPQMEKTPPPRQAAPPANPPAPPASTPAKPPSVLPKLITLCILAAAGYFGWKYRASIKSLFSSSGSSDAPTGRHAGSQAPPVVAATVKKGDIHIYLDGLGSVTPLNTVPVKTQVLGKIMNINFTEGQIVHVGDPLFLVDPRPYEDQLKSAAGQLERDQAILANDRIDLERYTSAAGAVS